MNDIFSAKQGGNANGVDNIAAFAVIHVLLRYIGFTFFGINMLHDLLFNGLFGYLYILFDPYIASGLPTAIHGTLRRSRPVVYWTSLLVFSLVFITGTLAIADEWTITVSMSEVSTAVRRQAANLDEIKKWVENMNYVRDGKMTSAGILRNMLFGLNYIFATVVSGLCCRALAVLSLKFKRRQATRN